MEKRHFMPQTFQSFKHPPSVLEDASPFYLGKTTNKKGVCKQRLGMNCLRGKVLEQTI
jgi:hypothetical protein